MKIAVPTRDNKVDDHFGHCEYYTIYTVNQEKQILSSETIPSPQGCGCKSDIAVQLQDMGVSVMLAILHGLCLWQMEEKITLQFQTQYYLHEF